MRTVSGALRATGSGVSKKVSRECPRIVKKVVPDTPGDTLRTFFWTLRSPGPKRPGDTPVGHFLGHPPFSGTLRGTLQARRARETAAAGRGVSQFFFFVFLCFFVVQREERQTENDNWNFWCWFFGPKMAVS